MQLLNRMKFERMSRGWTQWDLAKLTDIPESQIAQVETGKFKVSAVKAEKIGNVLGIPPNKLFELVKKEPATPSRQG